MTSIGGAGGAGGSGPIGPGGPVDGPDGPEGPGAARGADAAAESPAAGAAPTDRVNQLAADLDAGRITPEQAMAALIDESVAGLPPAEQAEVRRLMEDVVAADPYLGGLLGGSI